MSWKPLLYAIKSNGKYLKSIKPNEHYSITGTAPTMGARHCFHEFETTWCETPVLIEPITAVNYTKILLEEYRWNEREPKDVVLMPYIDGLKVETNEY